MRSLHFGRDDIITNIQCSIINVIQWAEWSWHSSTFPTSNPTRLGRNSVVCWQTILPRVISSASAGARSCRRKSTLFTNTWGTRKVPCFQAFQRTRSLLGVNLHFMTGKPGLYSEQSVTLRRTLKYSNIHLFNYDKNIPSPRNTLLLKLYIL